MGTAWPPPDADEQYDERVPNYALRRIGAGVAVAALLGGVAWFAVGRGDDGGDADDATVRGWDTVVHQDPGSGDIRVFDRDGGEVLTVETELIGLLDVGLDGTVVVGNLGRPATDGIGLLDLESGEIDTFDVAGDTVSRLAGSNLVFVYEPADGALELFDPVRRTVVDLTALTASDEPFVSPNTVRIDPDGTHLAFTEFTELETILYDTESGDSVSLPGALADVAFGRVVTMTNRGETVLLDLYDFDGERIGTVETPRSAAVMLADDGAALVATTTGSLLRVDFAAESIDEVADLAADLPAPDGDEDAVTGGAPVADRARLLLRGERYAAIVDPAGDVLRVVEHDDGMSSVLGLDPTDRCVTLAPKLTEPFTLLDMETGELLASSVDGLPLWPSDDGCTLLVSPTSGDRTVTRLLGPDLDEELDGQFRAVAPDASAVVSGSADGSAVLLLDSRRTIELTDELGIVVFALR